MVILGFVKNSTIQDWTSSVSQRHYLSVLQHNAIYHDTYNDEKTYEKKIYLISILGAEDQIAHLSYGNRKLIIIKQYCYSQFLDCFHLRFPGKVSEGWATAFESSSPRQRSIWEFPRTYPPFHHSVQSGPQEFRQSSTSLQFALVVFQLDCLCLPTVRKWHRRG